MIDIKFINIYYTVGYSMIEYNMHLIETVSSCGSYIAPCVCESACDVLYQFMSKRTAAKSETDRIAAHAALKNWVIRDTRRAKCMAVCVNYLMDPVMRTGALTSAIRFELSMFYMWLLYELCTCPNVVVLTHTIGHLLTWTEPL